MVEVNTRSVCCHRLLAASRSFFCWVRWRLSASTVTLEIDRRLLFALRFDQPEFLSHPFQCLTNCHGAAVQIDIGPTQGRPSSRAFRASALSARSPTAASIAEPSKPFPGQRSAAR